MSEKTKGVPKLADLTYTHSSRGPRHIVRELRLVAFVFFRVYGNLPNISCTYSYEFLTNFRLTQCTIVGNVTYIPK